MAAVVDDAPPREADPVHGSAGSMFESRERRGLPAWAVVAIVALAVLGLVGALGILVSGGIYLLGGGASDGVLVDDTMEAEPGTVTDSAGGEVTDGTGSYEFPATVGEHSFSWPTWTDGTLRITALELTADASLPLAAEQDVTQPGFQLVTLTADVVYEGEGQVVVAEELWVGAETDLAYYNDVGTGLLENPVLLGGSLRDGQSARITVGYLVPEAQVETIRIRFETMSGEPLYYGVG